MQKINIAEKLTLFDEHWSPRIIAAVNDQQIKLAKVQGEMIWHSHAHEDELFLVLKGELTLRFRDGEVTLREGEMLVVPQGVEHLPVAREECHLLLVERASTRHTGDVESELTRNDQPWI